MHFSLQEKLSISSDRILVWGTCLLTAMLVTLYV